MNLKEMKVGQLITAEIKYTSSNIDLALQSSGLKIREREAILNLLSNKSSLKEIKIAMDKLGHSSKYSKVSQLLGAE